VVDQRPVLVVTAADDPTADLVIDELTTRGVPVVRFDPGDFPRRLEISAFVGAGSPWRGSLTTASQAAALGAVRALYYRRPSPYTFDWLDPQDARFAAAQARHGLGGVLAALPGCLYLNHPMRLPEAELKPVQLAAATRLGFTVPATLVTNDPEQARRFAKQRPVVYKPLRVPPYEVDGRAQTIWVREVDPDEIDETVSGTAHMFQERVDKSADVRVTVVGHRVFCVRIDTDGDHLDWRYDYQRLSYRVVDPPAGLTRALRAYLDGVGLVFGAFDFALDRAGDWVFLECNPNGQWAWLEEATGLPMTAAFADLLERGAS